MTVQEMPLEYFGDGTFDFISPNICDGIYYRNAHWAITQCGMWNWMRNFAPEKGIGFTFLQHPNLKIIEQKMFEQTVAQGHSGASFGITLRQMSYIAKIGYDNFRNEWLSKHPNSTN
jgi:hypothetical protein